jgi:hypothetical protein
LVFIDQAQAVVQLNIYLLGETKGAKAISYIGPMAVWTGHAQHQVSEVSF